MKRMKLWLIPTVFALMATSAAAAVTSAEAEAPAFDVPLILSAHSNRTQYVLGEPVQVYLRFSNPSEDPVQFQTDFFFDEALNAFITNPHGQHWQFVDRIHTGYAIPVTATLDPGEARGVRKTIAHSDFAGLPFPEPGLYRLDFQLEMLLNAQPPLEIIRSSPITIEIIEPVRPADIAVHETFMQLEVAAAIQRGRALDDSLVPALREALETAPDSLFAEHAHFLLASVAMMEEEYLRANEHLYEIYPLLDGFHAKNQILMSIINNFHFSEERERALACAEIYLDLFPETQIDRNQLLRYYASLMNRPSEP